MSLTEPPVSLNEEEHDRLLASYRGRVDGYPDVDTDYRQQWSRWCRRLLAHSGDLVVPPMRPEADLDQLISDAHLQGPASQLLRGDDNACHANAAILWTDGTVAAIGTGYALSGDGLWRQHSWDIDAAGDPVETTYERRQYLGLVLSGASALRFAVCNGRDHVKAVLGGSGPRAHELAVIVRAARRVRSST